MKNLLLALCVSISSGIIAQVVQITPANYAQLKNSGQLQANTRYVFSTNSGNTQKVQPNIPYARTTVQTQSSAACNCMIPLDSTFSVVPFQAALPPDYRNDDLSTSKIGLPFQFNFFGMMKDSLYINNNGNISFSGPYFNFITDSFPSTLFDMIAAFWADVDTRDSGSGLVYYKMTPTAMIVKWDSVGYYNYHVDKRVSFQLIITNGADSILPPGNNVGFCYGDMQWTTGDASSGINGFGGTPATVGVNQGNGADYFQVGRFDTSGYAFDGPYGNADEVYWLNDQEIYFNTAVSGNIPPLVLNSNICDTIDVFTGDTLRTVNQDIIEVNFRFLTPEINQTVTATFTTNAPATALTVTEILSSNVFKEYNCKLNLRHLPDGIYTITARGKDNGSPARTGWHRVTIRTSPDAVNNNPESDPEPDPESPAVSSTLEVYPNPGNSVLTVSHGEDVAQQLMFVITDVSGRVVSQNRITEQVQQIELTGLPAGVYFGSLTNAQGTVSTVKIIRN